MQDPEYNPYTPPHGDVTLGEEAPSEEPSDASVMLGNAALILGAMGCGAILLGLLVEGEGLYLGGGAAAAVAFLLGLFGYIRDAGAKWTLCGGLLASMFAGMTDSEPPAYLGGAVVLVGLVLGVARQCNRGPAKAGMLVGLLGTLVFLVSITFVVGGPQEFPRPRPDAGTAER